MTASALARLEAGQIGLAEFVTTVAGEIRADAARFAAVPGAVRLEDWALSQLQMFLATRLTPTVAELVVAALRRELASPAPPQA